MDLRKAIIDQGILEAEDGCRVRTSKAMCTVSEAIFISDYQAVCCPIYIVTQPAPLTVTLVRVTPRLQ